MKITDKSELTPVRALVAVDAPLPGWEYSVQYMPFGEAIDPQIGADGWELVSVTVRPIGQPLVAAYFKRRR